MSWGAGVGPPWGGDPLTPVDDPLSEVGDEPVSFVFTDEADGPLPGPVWEPYIVTTAADVTLQPEPAQDTYFQVQSGYGLWNYTVPGAGIEQGALIGMGGILSGRNSRVSLFFRSPAAMYDLTADSFDADLAVLLRLGPEGSPSYVEARVTVRWTRAGGWTLPLRMTISKKDPGTLPVVLASVDPTSPDPVDTWKGTSLVELEAEIRGTALTLRVGGIHELTATVDADGADNRVGIYGAVFNTLAAVDTPVPSLVGIQLQSLRDLERLGPIPQLGGTVGREAPQIEGIRYLPLEEWLELGYLKREGSRRFVALTDFDAEVFEVRIGLRTDDVLRAIEPHRGQQLTACILDLASARGRG